MKAFHGSHELGKVLRHPLNVDRTLFSFFHAGAESSNFDVELAGGDTAGVPLARAGRVVSVTARADITNEAGGGQAHLVVKFDGASTATIFKWTANGAAQVKTGVIAPPTSQRFLALQELTVSVNILNTITVDDMVVTVEVELER